MYCNIIAFWQRFSKEEQIFFSETFAERKKNAESVNVEYLLSRKQENYKQGKKKNGC